MTPAHPPADDRGPAGARGLARFAPDPASRLYLEPRALLQGSDAAHAVDAGTAAWLAGGPTAFCRVKLWARTPDGATTTCEADIPATQDWIGRRARGGDETARVLWERLTATRPDFAGIALGTGVCRIMGIVNVTPDSFSDGGSYDTPEAAVRHGMALAETGADVIDVGGESTRPGADPVSPSEELRRVLPVITALAAAGHRVSIDTRRPDVMRAACEAGATVVNDVTALTGATESIAAAAASGPSTGIVLMHMQGEPGTMQRDPRYANVLLDVFDYLEARRDACTDAGIPPDRLCLDPGIGFGKTIDHNLTLIAGLPLFHGLGCALMLGASRKSFIGDVAGEDDATRRLPGSLAVALAANERGVPLLRVHDVAETRQALALARAIRDCPESRTA